MIQFYKCTRCGRIVEVHLERADSPVPRCREKIAQKIAQYGTYSETDFYFVRCGGRLLSASEGEIDELRNIS